jgi:hypothetical protein
MKLNLKILAILLALNISSVLCNRQASAQTYVSFQVFYDQLSPYGQWIHNPYYGYVWLPDAGPDFAPYSTEGHWILTDYGWTWVSDYNWGWAPFHYGRWDYDDYYGWYWIPDNEWGPSWVTWRRADGYYGWAPMGPGISIAVSFGGSYNSHHEHWMFVRDRDIERSDINRYYVNRTENDRIVRNSTVINTTYVDNTRHITYVSGPAREEVQKVTGRRISPVEVQENNSPGQHLSNDQLRIYRPYVSKNSGNGMKPAPSQLAERKDVKRTSERNAIVIPRNTNPSTNPTENNTRERQPNNASPQNSNTHKDRPSQPQNANPSENNRKEQQPNNTTPQNSNTRKAQPSQPQNVSPSENNKKEQHRNAENPPNSNSKEQPKKSHSEHDNK